MGLRDVLKSLESEPAPVRTAPIGAPPPPPSPGLQYDGIKREMQALVMKEIDVSRFDPSKDQEVFKAAVRDIVERTLAERTMPLSREERERLALDIVEETLGLGPLAPLFEDPAVSDILVNGPDKVYVERFGKLEKTEITFPDEERLLRLVERIVNRMGRHIDQQTPLVDVRMPDGSRVNAVVRPLSLDGPLLSIRRFGMGRLRVEDLIRFGTITTTLAKLLEAMVRARLNIMVSGGTGSGKTTLLNVLSSFISPAERIITIEDAAELKLNQEHVVRLESRPPNIEGKGAVPIRDLVINALRMRPDRIVVGEVRGAEAFDMLHAMTTGHEGGLTTIHANSPRDALKRLETMVLMTGMDLPSRAIRDLISSAIDVILQMSRQADGSRRLMSITEITGMEGDQFLTQEVCTYEVQEISERKVSGRHVATGVRPEFLPKLELRGFRFEPGMFRRGNPL